MAVTWITAEDTNYPLDPNAEYAAEAASWILYKLSGEKYPGVRSATEWYGLEGSPCWSCSSILEYDSSIANAAYTHNHHYFDSSSAFSTRGIRLRHTPVVSISNVSTASEDNIPSGSYLVANRAVLLNKDKSCWDLINGVEVSYEFGVKPPSAGRFAAQKLANEFILAMLDSNDCALPQRVQHSDGTSPMLLRLASQ